jgi:hypothetical protein
MLDMCRHLGFHIDSDPRGAGVCNVRLQL